MAALQLLKRARAGRTGDMTNGSLLTQWFAKYGYWG